MTSAIFASSPARAARLRALAGAPGVKADPSVKEALDGAGARACPQFPGCATVGGTRWVWVADSEGGVLRDLRGLALDGMPDIDGEILELDTGTGRPTILDVVIRKGAPEGPPLPTPPRLPAAAAWEQLAQWRRRNQITDDEGWTLVRWGGEEREERLVWEFIVECQRDCDEGDFVSGFVDAAGVCEESAG